MKHGFTNYIVGNEYDHIVLYAGKTRQELEYGRKAGRFGCYNGYYFDTIHEHKGSTNDKLLEQRHINAVRRVADMLPDVIEVANVNDDACYGSNGENDLHINQTIVDKIIGWIQGTRLMTEKRMAANNLKLANKIEELQSERAVHKDFMQYLKDNPQASSSPNSSSAKTLSLLMHPRAYEFLKRGLKEHNKEKSSLT